VENKNKKKKKTTKKKKKKEKKKKINRKKSTKKKKKKKKKTKKKKKNKRRERGRLGAPMCAGVEIWLLIILNHIYCRRAGRGAEGTPMLDAPV